MPDPRHRTYLEVERFRPSFCPYWECPDHRLPEGAPYRYQCRGLREIARAPGIVRRFLCKTCGRTFSSSVFFDCYRRKRPSIPEAVFRGYCEGQSGRQIARTTGLGLKAVQLLLRWMARQATERSRVVLSVAGLLTLLGAYSISRRRTCGGSTWTTRGGAAGAA